MHHKKNEFEKLHKYTVNFQEICINIQYLDEIT